MQSEGVASVAFQRNKSTYWPFGLACFKLRDSCMLEVAIHGVYIFCSDTKYGSTLLGFFIY